MIVLLPPSESKNPAPRRGRPLDIGALSFPELNPTRERVLRALVATSARPDAPSRLLVGETLGAEVVRNISLSTIPTRPALETYTGALFAALDPGSLSTTTRRRAGSRLVIVSSLWGALRPRDRIPPYRLNICANLVDLEPLEPLWRPVLGPVLTAAAGAHGLVVDCRSSSYLAMGMPQGIGRRLVSIRVLRPDGRRGADGHTAKRVRGEVVRHLLESATDPATAEDLAETLAGSWQVRLTGSTHEESPREIRVALSS